MQHADNILARFQKANSKAVFFQREKHVKNKKNYKNKNYIDIKNKNYIDIRVVINNTRFQKTMELIVSKF